MSSIDPFFNNFTVDQYSQYNFFITRRMIEIAPQIMAEVQNRLGDEDDRTRTVSQVETRLIEQCQAEFLAMGPEQLQEIQNQIDARSANINPPVHQELTDDEKTLRGFFQ
jgi:hypothetical protein